jgi:hypothetical protein
VAGRRAEGRSGRLAASALALKRETGLDLRAPLAGIDREQVSRVVA